MNSSSTSGFAQSGGLSIAYRTVGSGSPIILVHGWGADSTSNWDATGWVEALSAFRQVILLDVRGHGASDKPQAIQPYKYAAMSQDVLAVLDTLDIQTCDFMGYSMGAFIGAWLLGQHSDRFTSMILGGIGDETDTSAAAGLAIAAALRAPSITDVSDPTGKAVRGFVEANPTSDLEALAFSAEAMWPDGYPLKLIGDNPAEAHLPVLIVNGSEDHPYVDSADRMVSALPNAEHVQLPGADHLSAVTDSRFKTLVVDFLGAVQNQAGS